MTKKFRHRIAAAMLVFGVLAMAGQASPGSRNGVSAICPTQVGCGRIREKADDCTGWRWGNKTCNCATQGDCPQSI